MRILVPGVSGVLARNVALALAAEGHEVVGIDRRPWRDAPFEFHELDVRKRAAEDVFRKSRPQSVVHMATVTSLGVSDEERYRINLGGTRAVFEYCRAYGVEHFVFVGRHTFYGADPDSPLFHTEAEPPRALNRFPELADLVAADLFAATALWRSPDLATSVLRVCYTLGPSSHGTLATFLRARRVPMVLGFDPLYQYLHEEDAVRAIVITVARRPRGVFNVAGPQPLPLSRIIEGAGRMALHLPEVAARVLLGRFGLPWLPAGALTHLKYSILVDARAFHEQTGFRHQHDELATLQSFRNAFP